jgi:predicted nuclease of predicted toxin-antitoxin system
MMLKFKIDENLPVEAASLLSDAGYDAATVHEQRMTGDPDETIATACQRENRTIVTLDLDFADIRTYPPQEHCGIVVLRLAKLDKFSVLAVLHRLLPVLERESPVGKLWIVNESSVRVRD